MRIKTTIKFRTLLRMAIIKKTRDDKFWQGCGEKGIKGYYFLSHEKNGNPATCNNMNGPWGHHAEWNKPARDRQILYDVTYTWNLKKLNSQKQRVERWLPRAGERWEKWGDVGQKHQLPVIRWIPSGDLRYSVVTIANNTVLHTWKLLKE